MSESEKRRNERLAKQLRANLMRRKAQARQRDSEEPQPMADRKSGQEKAANDEHA